MNSLQIKSFLAVAKHMSFSAAAEELYVSQPSVSKQVSALENELGVCLFDRTRRRSLELTRAGILLRDHFSKSDAELQAILESVGAFNEKAAGKLNVSAITGVDLFPVLSGAAKNVRAGFPGFDLGVSYLPHRELVKQLERDQCDIVICFETLLLNRTDLNIRKVYETPIMLIYPKTHPLAGRKGLTPYDFRDYPLCAIAYQDDRVARYRQDALCQRLGFTPKRMDVPNVESLMLTIRASNGFSFVGAWNKDLRSDNYLSIRTDDTASVILAWKKSRSNSLILPFVNELQAQFSRSDLLL